jgi:23S rRNA pseudouridine1911/1915/1917 synthase
MGAEKTTPSVASHRFFVAAEDAGKRLDVLLAERIPELSRRRARVLIEAGAVSVDARRVLVQSRSVAPGQEIVCHLQSFRFPRSAALEPSAVLHEDPSLVAIEKASGVPSHPTFARKVGTALQMTEELLRARAGSKVPLWPLHRLDTDTSGVLLFAKTQAAARAVNQNFARRRVRKRYVALVVGMPSPESGEIALAIREGHLRSDVACDGKEAVTRYRTLERLGDAALLELEPLTGRMHQLRVHLAAIGHAILGDRKYGGARSRPASRLMLHAARLDLPHPDGGTPFAVESPLPEDFRAALAAIRTANGRSFTAPKHRD